MKRVLLTILILGGIGLILRLFINFFTNSHDISYSLVSADRQKYFITEKFLKEDNIHTYSFTVKNKKDIYSFSYQSNLNKQTNIISDIKYYKENNLKCIFPIYKQNYTSDISCLLDNKQVSYSYLQQINNKDINKIIAKLKKDKYDSLSWKIKNTKKNYNLISVYENNIPDNYIYTVWYYKGIYIINNEKTIKKQLLEKDKYDNDLAMLVGKFYVVVKTDDDTKDFSYHKLITYNIKDGSKKAVNLDDTWSHNTYINGISKEKLYVTDMDKKIQYSFDPQSGKIEQIGNEDIGYKKIENEEVVKASSEVVKKKTPSNDTITNKKITSLYGNVEIKKYRNDYYFKTERGAVYKIINNQYNKPIKLFEFKDLKEWKVKSDAITFINKDTIYMYTDTYGLRPIIIDKELNYNYHNIYDFMKK